MNCIRVQYPADRTSTRHASTIKISPSTPEPRAPLPGSNSVSEVRPLCRLKESIIHSVRRLCGLHQQEAHSRQAVRPPPVGKETCLPSRGDSAGSKGLSFARTLSNDFQLTDSTYRKICLHIIPLKLEPSRSFSAWYITF